MGSIQKLGLSIGAAALVLDQVVKFVLLYSFGFIHMAEGAGYRVTPFFDLVMVWNQGVSFGLFPADALLWRIVLILFALTVVTVLGVWLWRASERLTAIGIGMIMGGALGNVIDRVRFGAVADFFDFHAFGYHWYVFNVADAAIVIGVGILMYESLFASGKARPEATRE